MTDVLENHKIVSHQQWLAESTALLAKEKEFTRLRDELSRKRRELPWERVDKEYVFDGSHGQQTLSDLFGKCSQLIVYHFMFAPDWDAGCKHCSFWADNFNGIDIHLKHRDVSFVAISRAPFAQIATYKKRMDWGFTWLSSFQTDFNYDYFVSFRPEEMAAGPVFYNYTKQTMDIPEREGVSVFYKDPQGKIFHTYSSFARGIDMLNCAYNYLDLAPKGRDEDKLEFTQAWVRRHDEYQD